jgi:hypothetical protein
MNNKEIKVKRFNSNTMAETARGLLKRYGIESMIKVEGGVEFQGALGDSFGADLYVLDKDYEKAKSILDLEDN